MAYECGVRKSEISCDSMATGPRNWRDGVITDQGSKDCVIRFRSLDIANNLSKEFEKMCTLMGLYKTMHHTYSYIHIAQWLLSLCCRISITKYNLLPYSLLSPSRTFIGSCISIKHDFVFYHVFISLGCKLGDFLKYISLNNHSLYLLPGLLLNSFTFYFKDYNFHLQRFYLVV